MTDNSMFLFWPNANPKVVPAERALLWGFALPSSSFMGFVLLSSRGRILRQTFFARRGHLRSHRGTTKAFCGILMGAELSVGRKILNTVLSLRRSECGKHSEEKLFFLTFGRFFGKTSCQWPALPDRCIGVPWTFFLRNPTGDPFICSLWKNSCKWTAVSGRGTRFI